MDQGEDKFLKKFQENPSVPLGIAGLTAIVIYRLFKFKDRTTKPSIYLIHLRLAAQGTLMGSITLGLLYTLVKKNYPKFMEKNE